MLGLDVPLWPPGGEVGWRSYRCPREGSLGNMLDSAFEGIFDRDRTGRPGN